MRQSSERRLLIGGSLANSASTATWWLQPLIMQHLVSRSSYGDAAAGLVLTVEMTAVAIVAALMAKPLSTTHRLATVAFWATVLALLASVASVLTVHNYDWLLLSRIAAGVGEGVLLAIYARLGSQATDPAAMFAKIAVVNVIFGVVLTTALPLLPAWAGPSPSFALMGLVFLAVLPCTTRLRSDSLHPASENPQLPASAPPAGAGHWGYAITVAASAFAVGVCSGAVWAFYALLGEQAGVSAAYIESTIGLSVVAAGAGAAAAAVVGSRYGHLAPLSIGLAMMVAAVWVLGNSPSPPMYRIACCVNMATIYFIVPIFLGMAASADPSGRATSYVGSAFFFSGAVSPLVGGLLVEVAGFHMVSVGISVVAIAIVVAFVVLPRRQMSKTVPPMSTSTN